MNTAMTFAKARSSDQRRVAGDILAKRKTEVAMRVHFPTRAFDAVTFAELADYWWQAHGSKTRSQFAYLYPRVLEFFTDKRARDITPDAVDAFLDHLATERKLSASSINHHRTIVNGIFNFAVKRGRFDKNGQERCRQQRFRYDSDGSQPDAQRCPGRLDRNGPRGSILVACCGTLMRGRAQRVAVCCL
jgi:hypothetical protein